MILLDARPVSDAVVAAVSIAIATAEFPDQLAYLISDVPGTNRNEGQAPSLFAQVEVARRFEESANRLGSPAGSTAWRVIVGAISTSAGDFGASSREAEWVIAKAAAALEDVPLTTAGGNDLICRFESYRAPEWNDGSYWGSVTFTCAT